MRTIQRLGQIIFSAVEAKVYPNGFRPALLRFERFARKKAPTCQAPAYGPAWTNQTHNPIAGTCNEGPIIRRAQLAGGYGVQDQPIRTAIGWNPRGKGA